MVRTLKVSLSTHTLRHHAEAQSGKASEGYSDPTGLRQLSNLTIPGGSFITPICLSDYVTIPQYRSAPTYCTSGEERSSDGLLANDRFGFSDGRLLCKYKHICLVRGHDGDLLHFHGTIAFHPELSFDDGRIVTGTARLNEHGVKEVRHGSHFSAVVIELTGLSDAALRGTGGLAVRNLFDNDISRFLVDFPDEIFLDIRLAFRAIELPGSTEVRFSDGPLPSSDRER